jgi:hypothetical protein
LERREPSISLPLTLAIYDGRIPARFEVREIFFCQIECAFVEEED